MKVFKIITLVTVLIATVSITNAQNSIYSSDKEKDILEYNLSVGHKVVISQANLKNSKFIDFYIEFKMTGKKETNI